MPTLPQSPPLLPASTLWLGAGHEAPYASLIGPEHIDNYNYYILNSRGVEDTFHAIYHSIIKSAELRLKHVLELIREGSSVVVFIDRPWTELSYQTSDTHATLYLNDLPLLNYCQTAPLSGRQIVQADPKKEILDDLTKFRPQYHASLSGKMLIPLWIAPSKIKGREKVVAGFVRPFEKGGVIIFCPWSVDKLPNLAFPESMKLYIATWIKVASALAQERARSIIPDWAQYVNLSREHALVSEIQESKKTISELQSRIEISSKELAASDWQKELYTQTGRTLEEAVKRTCEAMGLNVLFGPDGKGDLIGVVDKHLIVLEVKGPEGATKETAASQCDRWVRQVRETLELEIEERSDYHHKYAAALQKLGITTPLKTGTSMPVKGVIVSNTHRATPVDQRPSLVDQAKQHFSDALQGAMKTLDIAALTTIQLLGIYSAWRDDEATGRAYLSKLISEKGLSEICRDETKFLLFSRQ